MKIAFHDNQLCLRGTTIALFDNAYWGRYYLDIEPIIVYPKVSYYNDVRVLPKFQEEFQVFSYSGLDELNKIIETEECDYLFAIKGGNNPEEAKIVSRSCPTLINAVAVCNKSHVHGDRFAMCSKWLSSLTNFEIPYVPHMVWLPDINEDLREELNIPQDALVIGRNGGPETFDLQFVKEAIRDSLKMRSNIYFLFQNTDKFIEHERVINIPCSYDLEYKTKFINTCDAMLHARQVGESFGLSCAEFSIRDKPIITYLDSPERNHIDILKNKGLYYKNFGQIRGMLCGLTRDWIKELSGTWNAYEEYYPEPVMKKFKEVYLT